VRYHRSPPVTHRQVDRGERLRQGPDLVYLDKNAVGAVVVYSSLEELDVCDEQVIPDDLKLLAKACVELAPTFPVIFAQPVLNAADGVLFAPARPDIDHLIAGGDSGGVGFEEAVSFLALRAGFVDHFARIRVQRYPKILARFVTCSLYRTADQFGGFVVGF